MCNSCNHDCVSCEKDTLIEEVSDYNTNIILFTNKVRIEESNGISTLKLDESFNTIVIQDMNCDNQVELGDIETVVIDDKYIYINNNFNANVYNKIIRIYETHFNDNTLILQLDKTQHTSKEFDILSNRLGLYPKYTIDIDKSIDIETQSISNIGRIYLQLNKDIERQLIYTLNVGDGHGTEVLFSNIQSVLYDLYILDDTLRDIVTTDEYSHIYYNGSLYKLNKNNLISEAGLNCNTIDDNKTIYIPLLLLARLGYSLISKNSLVLYNNEWLYLGDTINKPVIDDMFELYIISLNNLHISMINNQISELDDKFNRYVEYLNEVKDTIYYYNNITAISILEPNVNINLTISDLDAIEEYLCNI